MDAGAIMIAAANGARPMVKARRLYHINLNVSDIDRALRFYQQAFGLVESFRQGPLMVFLSPPSGDDVITLHQTNPVGPQGVAHFGFEIEDGNLDDAVAAVLKAGGKFLSRGTHAPGVLFAYVQDPDGYVIELSPA
jgi:catechol 2,3-dioxygenase-like lactoylglutathione lyase family enzyme